MKSANDDLSFGDRTVIFGANKVGKSTFVAILKSLKEGKKSYITSRKTFGTATSDKQECEILFGEDVKATYDSEWFCENLEIFDNDFIHRNIFIGDKIELDHKTKLHKILIDEGNLKLLEKIDTEEKNYAKFLGEKEDAKKDIGIYFDDFIKLTEKDEDKDVVAKLKNNQGKQKLYYNHIRLNQLKSSTKLTFDFDAFEANIKQDIDSNLEEKIKDHIKTCWGNDSKDVDFLNIGVSKISSEKNLCPFCGQNLENVSVLISDMRNYFGEIYKKTQTSIKDAVATFKTIDFQKEIAQFKAEGFEFLTQFNDQSLSDNFKVIIEKLEQKQKDLSTDIKLEDLDVYKEYKKVIMSMNAEVKSLKVESIDIVNLQKEEAQLKLNQERFSATGKANYKKYKLSEKAVYNKKSEIDALNTDLKEKLNDLFNKYLGDINTILRDSFANFQLADLKSISNRSLRESFFCDYVFIFDGTHRINIVNEEDKPQFKNTLSDSDKRIFAFAFFIAKLKSNSSLRTKIVVLDDPFTSLDEERRDPMIAILKDLGCEQLIIFSHNRSFVKRCILKFSKNRKETGEKVKTLRLQINSLNKTEIGKLDTEMDGDFLDDVEKYLKTLLEANVATIASDYDNTRKIIEHIVRSKYGHLLSNDERVLPMLYFKNDACLSPVKDKIQEYDYQENLHDTDNLPTPEELICKRDTFISEILPKI